MVRTVKGIIAFVLVFTLLLSGLTVPTAAAGDGCSHVHSADCGYAAGAACGHSHDAACGYRAAVACTHAHNESCGEGGRSLHPCP